MAFTLNKHSIKDFVDRPLPYKSINRLKGASARKPQFYFTVCLERINLLF